MLFDLKFIDCECDGFSDALNILLEKWDVACPVEIFNTCVDVVDAGDGVS